MKIMESELHLNNIRREGISFKEGENADYKKDIKVTQYGKNGDERHHYHFLGAFPTALSTIALDWGTQEIEEYTCTWTFDRWMPGTSDPKSPIHHLFPGDEHRYNRRINYGT